MRYCPNCGNEVTGQDKFCRNCGAEISKTSVDSGRAKSVHYEAQRLNWAQRHLNWTVVLTAIAANAIAFAVSVWLLMVDPTSPDSVLNIIYFAIVAGIVLPVGAWALRRKYRSLWWLLILFVPFGWIAFLCLENRRFLLEHGDEFRSSYLAYYEELAKLTIFQTKEADLFNSILMKYGYSTSYDRQAVNELARAAQRLLNSTTELNRRAAKLPPLPDEISRLRSFWRKTFNDYLAWSQAQAASIEAMAEGRKPMTKRVRELFKVSERSQKVAANEDMRIIQLLKIKPSALQMALDNATIASESENRQPQDH